MKMVFKEIDMAVADLVKDWEVVLWVEASSIFIYCSVLIWEINYFNNRWILYLRIHLDSLSNNLNLFNAMLFQYQNTPYNYTTLYHLLDQE